MRLAILSTLAASLVLGGCALPGARESLAEDQGTLVARDFVNALARLRGFSPRGTTVQLRPAATAFGESLERELRQAGFGTQGVAEDDEGPLLVTYEADRYESEAGESVGYRVRVGGVELGREYELRAGRVFPATALSVRGVEIDAEPLDGSIFDRRVPLAAAATPSSLSGIEDRAAGAKERVPSSRPRTLEPPLVVASDDRAEYRPLDTPSGVPEERLLDMPAGTASASGIKRNYLELGESNFASLLDRLLVADRRVLVFGFDSMRLDEASRKTLATMVEGFDPRTDVMSVIGCSHGKSRIPSGNEFLATGRANRVKEELILLGLDPGSVLDEGCWAGSDQPGLPARGVIVTRQTLDTTA